MIVMKFGGSSLKDASAIRRSVSIVSDRVEMGPLVVVSAVGGTTRRLLELGETARSEGLEAASSRLDDLLDYHRSILTGLEAGGQNHQEAEAEIHRLGTSLRRLLEGVTLLRDLSPKTQDAILSHGERFSTLLFSTAARKEGIQAVRVDAARIMITDERFRAARPDRGEIRVRAEWELRPLLSQGQIPVLEGFIGATRGGVPTTMGFEASDYTASLLGAALGATEIQIWTDVPGILTSGRQDTEGVLVVHSLSYDAAADLSFFGAKVLHPRTIEPAVENLIPVYIRSSREPDGQGTRISGTSRSAQRGVSSIAVIQGVVVTRFKADREIPLHRSLGALAQALDEKGVSPHLMTLSGYQIAVAAEAPTELPAVMKSLDWTTDVFVEDGCAMVTPVSYTHLRAHET